MTTLTPEQIEGLTNRRNALSGIRVVRERITRPGKNAAWSEVHVIRNGQSQFAHCADDEDADFIADILAALPALLTAASEADGLRAGLNGLVNCQSPLSRTAMRSAAADILRNAGIAPTSLPDQSPFVSRAEKAEAEAASLRAEVSRLREALKPFAEIADWYHASESEDFPIFADYPHGLIDPAVTKLRNFRLARSALATPTPQPAAQEGDAL